MNDIEKIAELKRLLFRESAMRLFNYQQYQEGETRDWEDVPPEELSGRLELAERFMKIEAPEVFADD